MSDLVRLGRNADGGYLLPRQVLDDVTGCISLGLGLEWSFEKDLLQIKKGEFSRDDIIFFDGTVSVLDIFKHLKYMALRTHHEIFTKKLQSLERKYKVEDLKRVLIGLFLFVPVFKFKNTKYTHIQKLVVKNPLKENECSLREALSYRQDLKNTIIKIDIEGGEWEILRELSDIDLISDAPVFIIEIHDSRREDFKILLSRLKVNFWLAHIHGNTSDRCDPESGMPMYMEMTFVNKRYSPDPGIRKSLPIDGLDFPGRPGEKPHEMVFKLG